MTMICPACGNPLRMTKTSAGPRAKCRECGKVFRLPPQAKGRNLKSTVSDTSVEGQETESNFDFADLAELEAQCPSLPRDTSPESSLSQTRKRNRGRTDADQPKHRTSRSWISDSLGVVWSLLDTVREFVGNVLFDSPMLVRIGGPILGLVVLAYWLNSLSTHLTGDPEGALRDARQLAAQAAELKPGMRQQDVEKLLGPPHEIAGLWFPATINFVGHWHPWSPPAFVSERDAPARNNLDRTIRIDFSKPVAEWSGANRVYVAVTSKRLESDVLHVVRPQVRPGETVGDLQRRNKKFQKSLEGGVDDCGFYLFLTYDDQQKIVDVTAWCAEFPEALNVRRPPGWSKSNLGTEILQSAKLVARQDKPADRPQEVAE